MLRRRQAELLPHRPAEPGTGLLVARPHAVIEAAENDHVGLLQARFERPPDEEARVESGARAHDLAGEEAAVERRIVGCLQSEALPRIDQLRQQQGQCFARIALP